MSKYEVFSGHYFPTFGLNTEIYEVSLRMQPEYRKIQTRKNSLFWHFSHSSIYDYKPLLEIGTFINEKWLFFTFNFSVLCKKAKHLTYFRKMLITCKVNDTFLKPTQSVPLKIHLDPKFEPYQALHKKWSFPLRISSVNMTKFAQNWGVGHIYWKNP